MGLVRMQTSKIILTKNLSIHFFFANKTAANEVRLKEKENEVFFIFVMLTDSHRPNL